MSDITKQTMPPLKYVSNLSKTDIDPYSKNTEDIDRLRKSRFLVKDTPIGQIIEINFKKVNGNRNKN